MLNTIILQAANGGSNWSGILMIVAMIAIFYLFMIRPQQKKQKDLKKQRDAMKNGDRVVTAGGIYGRIKDIKETTISIEIAPNVSIKVDKGSVYPAAQAEEIKK
ncbi:MAG: preprotein translocase subunit YajC [Bacteroides sp.]|nr:preprotein translocase subunit YajC [Bacteroidales bacterium]MBD5197453.1 preprotein translocase subunit YajC [Bacteroidales bacterium]MBD5303721.1 preprotein translocase subunit YajC [Bacteroides sp.]MBD5341160.1 preprotein translocase subunit YajC [Bacteroides sp.]